MKKLTAIFILFAILGQISGSLVIFSSYEINKKYISENLCVNKARPFMHCNGKCHLAKELAKAEKKEKSPVNSGKEKFEALNTVSITNPFFVPSRDCEFSIFIIDSYSSPYSTILQPPKV